jgi:probable HAF family extracellular repeat protein
MNMMNQRATFGAMVLATLVVAVSPLHAQSAGPSSYIVPLGDLPGGGFESVANGINADGSIVVGFSRVGPSYSDRRAFRWSLGTGMIALDNLQGSTRSEARAVNADGSVIAGMAETSDGTERAMCWTIGDGVLALPDFGGAAAVNALSRDGSVMVGTATISSGRSSAVRWLNGAITEVTPSPPGTSVASAIGLAVSGDGTRIAGTLVTGPNFETHGFLTPTSGGVYTLVTDPISALNATGDAGVGVAAQSGTLPLGYWFRSAESVLISAADSSCGGNATCISADGRLAGGSLGTECGAFAILWSRASGPVRLDRLLSRGGANWSHWRQLSVVTGMSADGLTVCGYGVNTAGATEAFVAAIAGLCAADLDDGTGTGTLDGGVTLDDLVYFISRYAAGDNRCDLDDGAGFGNPDGGVTLDDLLFFLSRFSLGC